jgi:glycosyltransferase involved in cell wall biosynthesis
MAEENRILLSVGIISYNQEKFIDKAIRSVMEQQTSFAYEILICDDCSTDGTLAIVKPWLEKFPQKIRLICNEKNCGPLKNGKNFYDNALGKYLAWLDADDYWIHPLKLQTQIDFLENNTKYVGCFHDSKVISSISENASEIPGNKQNYSAYKLYSQFNRYNIDIFPYDILQRNIIPTASLVFRNGNYSGFFDLFKKVNISTQWALHLFIIRESKFRFINEVWSVYNDHPKGLTKTIDLIAFNKSNLFILKTLRKDPYYKYCKLDMNRAIHNEYREILYKTDTLNLPYFSFLKLFLQYKKYTIRLFFSESKYFFRLRRNKTQ